ncbi:MAG: hypothetical protein ABIR57_07825 [Aeromicrobium sp.]
MTENNRAARRHTLLVVADGEIDIDLLRRRFTEIVVVHPRPDGSFDPLVGDGFDRAFVSGRLEDPHALRSYIAFVRPRIRARARIEFLTTKDSLGDGMNALTRSLRNYNVTAQSWAEGTRILVAEEKPRRLRARIRQLLRRIRPSRRAGQ